ncbi:MAG: V-type ATP synthase subunit E [Draconibacterium sp.]|nr:V-type ATP synthase subunit E [Draconibacterium sp.]
MTNKIQELTEKIYNEGIVKAKVEADQIIADAKKEAGKIIKAAEIKEVEILEQAKIEAAEFKKNTNSEIQLAARQFISKLKQQITNLVTIAQVEPPVKVAFNDNEFIKNIIITLIQNWNPQKPEEFRLNILLPEKDEKEFSEFFETKAIDVLNKGINILFDSKTTTGFKIGSNDGSYIIGFSDKDFENYFKGYIKDRTKKLLFENPLPTSSLEEG